jgi:glycosyltransferase involved in cell wall biosynthesis
MLVAMKEKLNILSVGSTAPGGDIEQPRGYGRAILSSLGALAARGHTVRYLQLGGTTKVTRRKCMLSLIGREVEIEVIKIPINNSGSEFNNFILFSSPNERANFAKQLENSLDIKPDIVISESNALYYFGAQIAKHQAASHVLHVHSIRGIYPKQVMRASHSSPLPVVIREIFKCPLSVLHTASLAHLSDYVITLTQIEEVALRRMLVGRISTVPPSYIQFSEEVEAPPYHCGSPYVFLMQGDPSLITGGMKDITVVMVGKTAESQLKVSQKRKNSNIIIMKNVSNYTLASIIKGASIIASPRIITTGVGMGIVEALAYGKAMITTSVASSKLVGLKNGLHLIIEDDFAKWPDLIQFLLSDNDLRTKLEMNSKNYFANNLAPNVHGAILESILSRLAVSRTQKRIRSPEII